MFEIQCFVTGCGVTAGHNYYAMDFIREDDNSITAVIQDDDGMRHFLSQSNYKRLN